VGLQRSMMSNSICSADGLRMHIFMNGFGMQHWEEQFALLDVKRGQPQVAMDLRDLRRIRKL
jgi:hypothetical protein